MLQDWSLENAYEKHSTKPRIIDVRYRCEIRWRTAHLLIGLGLAACEQGPKVRYVTCAQLVNELVEAADERVLSRVVARYGRLDLLLLDELLSQESGTAALGRPVHHSTIER
jgi:IstB-like ATP binding protein